MDESRPLHEQINRTTRKLHTVLNRLVVFYLPLAVPPAATSPQAYASGISAFAQVYYAFEKIWVEQLQSDQHLTSDEQDLWAAPRRDGDDSTQHRQDRIRDVLRRLYVPGLMRAESLRYDLAYLTNKCMSSDAHGSCPTHPSLQAFVLHIRISITERPHLLLAYAWIFYMALFSGGRWIRAQLYAAGEDFWTNTQQQKSERSSQRATPSEEPLKAAIVQSQALSFFHFPGDDDGEDIKHDFKARFAEVELSLTAEERREIVAESMRIFQFSISMVQELDSVSHRQRNILQLSRGGNQQAKPSLVSAQRPVSSSLSDVMFAGQTSGTWSLIPVISYLFLLVFGYISLRVFIASLLSAVR